MSSRAIFQAIINYNVALNHEEIDVIKTVERKNNNIKI